MITFFAIPRAFEGHYNIIQRNALASWKLLPEGYEVILFGDDAGVAEVAKEFGFKHIAHIERNEFGSPLLSYLFNTTREVAKNDIICAIMMDIILMSDFPKAITQIKNIMGQKDFLMVGGRHDLDVTELVDISDKQWEQKLIYKAKTEGKFHGYSAMDYFIYPKNLLKDFPQFIVGVVGWDSWLLATMRKKHIPVIDASDRIFAIHQNHDRPRRRSPHFKEELRRSYALAGGSINMMTLREADNLLVERGLVKPSFPRSVFAMLALWYPWQVALFLKRELWNLLGKR